MALTQGQILEQISLLLDAGDMEALEKFMVENFKDLPEMVQGDMLLSYLKQSVSEREADVKIAQLQETILDALDSLQDENKE